uniref:Aminopeptidase n=1 Tax=Cnaphalocrocis medinalis TaxID=437488 RepID=G9C5G3_CNAME|nr:aminopeptidase N2 [Cnaphalocrocis medinalis]
MSFLTKLVLVPALLAVVRSEFPFDLEADLELEPGVTRNEDLTSYRLPEDLDPIHADIEITPYFETAPAGKEPFTFDGVTRHIFKAVKDNLNAFVLQDNVRDVRTVSLTTADGTLVALNAANPFERIRQYFFLKINLAEGITLVNGEIYHLTIEYIGNINETPMTRGMFRGSYIDNGTLHWYAACHLQPTHGRQLFPSFDEPGFKSTFNITVNRPANFTETFSNMRIRDTVDMGDRVKEYFYQTPRMSAYLITIHISAHFKVLSENYDNEKSYRIIGRPNAEGQGEYALEVGPPLTKWMEDYFGIEYYTMGEDMKNDQLASPDWASGATENWGLVSYRELRLLYEEGETNAADKISIGTITAHELAHKWFGNYITARWWDNVWINEGFASYFEYFAMDAVDKDLELKDQFNIMYLQSALSADSSASTRALRHTVNSPAEVTGHFSGISYTKGASLLLMLKHFLSEDTFKKALHTFLVDRAYEHAFPEDLYRAFKAAVTEDGIIGNVDIEAFLNTWVDQPGYPVLSVSVDTNSGLVSLKQDRFYLSATATPTDETWPLPLTYTTSRNPDWENLTPSEVMLGKTHQIPIEPGYDWVIFNVQQQGIYRVNYDTKTWENIANSLRSNHATIHHLNRAQIVDDVFALMRSENMKYDLGFRVLDFLKQDTSYFSWYPAITGLNWIRNRFLHLPEVLAQYDEQMYEFLDAVIKDLGYDVPSVEPVTKTLNRFYTLTFACNIGHKGCTEDAVQKFRAYRDGTSSSVNPNLRRHVFCQGLREGGYEDWKFLKERLLRSNNQADSIAMLRSLGCTPNEQAIQEYLEMLLSDNIKAQDRLNGFTFLFMGNRGNSKVALQFLKQRVADIRAAVILPASFNSILSNMAAYLDNEGLDDMEQWLRNNQADVPEFNVGLNAIASARTSMKWGTDRAKEILEAVQGSGTVPGGAASIIVPTITLLLSSVVAMMLR